MPGADSIDCTMTNWTRVRGLVVSGHGVASGLCNDPRFPGGTIALQKPVFRQHGLNLDYYFSGTINLSIAPLLYQVKQARHRFRGLRWSDQAAAEDFSFIDCRLLLKGRTRLEGMVYYPHPETKPEHFQSPDILEILTYPIEGLTYGDTLTIEVDPKQIKLLEKNDIQEL
jgi:hypothetical protein